VATVVPSVRHSRTVPSSPADDPHHDHPAIDLPVNTVPAYAMVTGTAYRLTEPDGCGNGLRIVKSGVDYPLLPPLGVVGRQRRVGQGR